MRCMACGDEMVLAEAVPADAMGVKGFEHQTFQCPGCHDTERRLVFTGRIFAFARREIETATSASEPCEIEQPVGTPRSSNAPHPETICKDSSVEVVAAAIEEQAGDDGASELASEVAQGSDPPVVGQDAGASAGNIVSAQAWVRAIEKLRSYQADLHQRAEEAKKTNWNVEFDEAWDSFSAPLRNEWLDLAQPNGIAPRREQLRLRARTTAGTFCSQSPEPAQEPDWEAVRRFNEFWDRLAPSHGLRQMPLAAPPMTPNPAAPDTDNVVRAATGGTYLLKVLEKLVNAVEAALPSRSLI
jgi:hypothetical protein